jgi:predicted RNase H-like nuclease (RuvC/YqgF family)
MKKFVIILFLSSSLSAYTKNPIMQSTSPTSSTGYLVGCEKWDNSELQRTEISIADLLMLMKEVEKNPKIKDSYKTRSGYLIVYDGWSNSEIRATDIKIEDILKLMAEFEALKRENEILKRKIEEIEKKISNLSR